MSLRAARRSRVAVIGAGFAGLAAAHRLIGDGHEVGVFEARDRVGGRVWSETIEVATGGSAVIERGAEFVLSGYDKLRAFAGNLKLDLVDTGMSYYVRRLAEHPEITTEHIAQMGGRAAEIARSMSGHPSVADVLGRLHDNPNVLEALRCRVEISSAADASEVRAAVLDHVASFEEKPSWRVSGGNQSIAKGLAATLGDRVFLNTPVSGVTEGAGHVTVHTAEDDSAWDAAVVALPLGVVLDPQRIQLPRRSERERLLERIVQGHAAKLHIPLASVPETSAVMSVPGRFWNWTALDSTGKVAPVLNGFMGSQAALERFDVEHSSYTWEVASKAARPDLDFAGAGESVTTTWANDPLSLGAYSAYPAGWTDANTAALDEPVGEVYFAGEYMDPTHTGLMEGALRSGIRAAERVTAAMDREVVA
jgi:monoamine oxidase